MDTRLDDKYILCKVIIYKIADYIKQVPITCTNDELPTSYEYVFIGNILNFSKLP
jgi:hypothetical protein